MRVHDFGRRLRSSRVEFGMSLRALAEAIDLSATYISDVENGRRGPLGAKACAAAAKVLQLPSGFLEAEAERDVAERAIERWRAS